MVNGGDTRVKARLALVHYSAAPVVGGVERIVGSHARLLREAGYRVRVIAGRGNCGQVPELDSRHPEVERLTRRLEEGTADLVEFKRLQDRIAQQLRPLIRGCDLAIVHNMLTMPFNLPAACTLLGLGLPLLAWTHDLSWTEERYAGFHRAAWPYDVVGRPQPGVRYIAVSESRRRDLAQGLGMPPEEIAVVPNGIDPGEVAGLSEGVQRLLTETSALEAEPLVLVPQRVTANKRLELVLEAAVHARKRFPKMHVIVTGPLDSHAGSSEEYGRLLLRRRDELGLGEVVHFLFPHGDTDGLHPVGTPEVAQLYLISDVILMPSRSEGFGLPLLEAALARVPVVCSDIAPFAEVGGEGVYRFPVDAAPEQIVSALEAALEEPAILHRRAVLGRFAWSTVRRRLFEAVERALGDGSPAESAAIHEDGDDEVQLDPRDLVRSS